MPGNNQNNQNQNNQANPNGQNNFNGVTNSPNNGGNGQNLNNLNNQNNNLRVQDELNNQNPNAPRPAQSPAAFNIQGADTISGVQSGQQAAQPYRGQPGGSGDPGQQMAPNPYGRPVFTNRPTVLTNRPPTFGITNRPPALTNRFPIISNQPPALTNRFFNDTNRSLQQPPTQ